jgi:hypothetical protein
MLLPKVGDLVQLSMNYDNAIVLVVEDKPYYANSDRVECDLFRGYILGSDQLKLFSKVHIIHILSGEE